MNLLLEAAVKCVNTGGKHKEGAFVGDYCDCRGTEYYPGTHKCNNGKVEKL